MLKSICCEADPYECLKGSFGQFNKNFARGFIIRLLLVIVQSRNRKKIMTALKSEVPKFGVTLGVTAAFYHSMICLLKRTNKLFKDRQYLNLTKKSMCTLAAFMSGIFLSANLANGEKNLLKLLFYPLAFRCLSDKLLEIGLVPKFKHGDIIMYMIVGFFAAFSTLIEWNSCPDNLRKTI